MNQSKKGESMKIIPETNYYDSIHELKKGFANPEKSKRSFLEYFKWTKVVNNPEKIEKKLVKELTFTSETEDLKVRELGINVWHSMGRRPEMEDHIVKTFPFTLSNKTYPIKLFVQVDRQGGNKASLYVAQNLEEKLKKNISLSNPSELSNNGIWNALKITMVELSEECKTLGYTYETTPTVALTFDGLLTWEILERY